VFTIVTCPAEDVPAVGVIPLHGDTAPRLQLSAAPIESPRSVEAFFPPCSRLALSRRSFPHVAASLYRGVSFPHVAASLCRGVLSPATSTRALNCIQLTRQETLHPHKASPNCPSERIPQPREESNDPVALRFGPAAGLTPGLAPKACGAALQPRLRSQRRVCRVDGNFQFSLKGDWPAHPRAESTVVVTQRALFVESGSRGHHSEWSYDSFDE
jgi:hypothetical protein